MKKMLMFAAAAAMVALSFTSCEKKPEPVSDLTIKLSQKTLDLAVGEEAKLRATVTPAKDGLTLVWKSTDEKVATVTSAGLVTGVATGDCMIIVSAEGAKAETCVVTVTTLFDALEWSGFTLWNHSKDPMTATLDTIELSNGMTVVCGVYAGEWHVWDKNIAFDETEGSVSGAGFVAIYDYVPTYVIVDDLADGKFNGYYIGTPGLRAFEGATVDSLYCVPDGKLTNLVNWATYLMHEESDLDETDCFQGASIHYLDYDNEQGAYYLGLVKNGTIVGDEAAVQYRMNVTWLDEFYGLKVTEDGEALVEPLTQVSHDQSYELVDGAASARVEARRFVAPKNDVKVNRNLAKDKFARK